MSSSFHITLLLILLCCCCLTMTRGEDPAVDDDENFDQALPPAGSYTKVTRPSKEVYHKLTLRSPYFFVKGKIEEFGAVDMTDVTATFVNPNAATETAGNNNNKNNINYVTLHVMIFPEPSNGSPSKSWVQQMGLGTMGGGVDSNQWQICCTIDLQQEGLCNTPGNIIVSNPNKFNGIAYQVFIPRIDNLQQQEEQEPIHLWDPLKDHENRTTSQARAVVQGTGTYILFLTSCNLREASLDAIQLQGYAYFDSFVTPQDLILSFFIYMLLVLCHFILYLWFQYSMIQNKNSRIALEEWIRVATIVGLLHVAFKCIQFTLEVTGIAQMNFIRGWTILTLICNAFKHGISRALFLVLSLGWGVVQADFTKLTMGLILILTFIYTISIIIYDLMRLGTKRKTREEYDGITLSKDERILVSDMWIMAILEFALFVWIVVALIFTILKLRSSGQERKLNRFWWLSGILGFVILTNICTLIAFMVIAGKGFAVSFLAFQETNDFNFFVAITLVAVLWKPNPSAREFVFVEQLSMNDDDVGHDLELTESSVAPEMM